MMHVNRGLTWRGGLLAIGLMLHVVSAWADSSAEYLAEGKAYLEKGKVGAAVIQLKNALKQDPRNKEARLSLGEAYLLGGEGAGAEKEFERARSLGVGMAEVAPSLGRAYLMQGKADEVLDKIRLEDAYPASLKADILVVRAHAHMQKAQPKEAEKTFGEALEQNPKSVDAMLGLARMAALNQQWDKAIELTDKALAIDPNSSEGWAIKGEIARQKGDLAAADSDFDKALSLQPLNPPALLGSAGVNLLLGNAGKANKAIDQLLKLNPDNPLANYLRAVSLYRDGDSDAAAETLQIVLRTAPNHLPSLQMMGAIDFARGNFEQAKQALSRVVAEMPDNIAAVKLLATTLLQLGDGEQAIDILRKASAKSPEDAQLLALLGSAYLRTGQNVEGIKSLERAVELDPQAAGVRTQLALGRLASGETSQAVKELETAVDLGKNVFQAELMLTLVHLRNRDFDQALNQARVFAEKNPDSPLPHNLAGAAYLGLGKVDEARREFNQALKKDARFLPARMNLGRMDERAGKSDEAEKAYRAVLKQKPDHLGALMSLARLAAREGKDEEALKYLQEAWESNDGAIPAGLALVRYYNQHKQPLRAVSIAREMEDKHPDNPRVLNALGLSQLESKDYHAALATFEALQRLLPQSAQPYYLLGLTRKALKQPKEARQYFEKALTIAEDHLPAQLALARLEMQEKHSDVALRIAQQIQRQRPGGIVGYRLEGDILMANDQPAAAAEAYRKGLEKVESPRLVVASYAARKKAGDTGAHTLLKGWLEKHPDDLMVRAAYANALQEAGDLQKAVVQYQEVLAKRPDDVVVLNNLAWVAQQLGRSDAVQFAERAYKLAPDNPAIMDTLGWLLVETGKPEKGIVLLQRAVSLAPLLAEIRYHYGVALHKLDRDQEAKLELSRALDMSKDFAGAEDARSLLQRL